MPRITCKTPSPGRSVNYTLVSVGTSYATLAEAPDFSVPDTNQTFPTRDPLDTSRAIRPGEVSFLTPMWARNKTGTERWVEVQLLTEAGTAVAGPRVIVPPNDSVPIPVQGRSLLKRNAAGSNGDRLQVRCEATSSVDVWATGEERLSAEHIGVVS